MDFLFNSLLSRADVSLAVFIRLLIQGLVAWNLLKKMGFRGANFWILLVLATFLPLLTLLVIGFNFFQWPVHGELDRVTKENEELNEQLKKLRAAYAKRQQQRKPPQT